MKSRFLFPTLATLAFVMVLLAQDSIVGIGVSLGTDSKTGDPKILKVIPGGPADKAGVKGGDNLRKVNGTDVHGMTISECVSLIRGPIGSKVRLEIATLNAAREVEITRDKIVMTAPVSARRGDAAAALQVKEWVKGGPIDPRDGKNIYVVEFWATWCPPCRVSIPHLTELQKRYKDKGVVVIGISDEDSGKVKPFVAKMSDKMDYVVACDDDRQTFSAYMEAYRHDGIPTAFVIDKAGKVVWDGHPMAGLDKAIEAVLAGAKPE